MSSPFDAARDEPTLVGRRPIGPLSPAAAAAPAQSEALAWLGQTNVPGATDPGDRGGSWEFEDEAGAAQIPAPTKRIEGAPKNPEDVLAAAASPLLIVVANLRNVVQQADIVALRKELAEQVRGFEARAQRFGARIGDISASRYALCAFVDKSVMTTPWGSESAWSTNSLLLEMHAETWGGEKFFAIVDRASAQPVKYLALLKLLDACLSLGFEGKYRVLDDGREQLARLRADVGRLLEKHQRPAPAALSSLAKGASPARRLRHYLPLWVVFAVSAAILVASYGVVKWRIASETAGAEQTLKSIAAAD